MDMAYNVISCIFETHHSLCKNVTGCCLAKILNQLAAVCLFSAPLVCCVQAFKGERHSSKSVRLQFGIDICKSASGRQNQPQHICIELKADTINRPFLVVLHRFNSSAFHIPPELDYVGIRLSPGVNDLREFGFFQSHFQCAHGNLTLDQAFVHSCNVTYASLALEMGDARLRAAAENFGFNRNFLFRDLVVYNSRYPTQAQSREALAASGFGQSAVAATPMHLCLMAAAIARGGDMPEPRLLKQVTTSAGGTVLSFSSASVGSVCAPAVAEKLSAMMKQVVQGGGSGAQAAVTTLDVRGKTGTAVSTVDGHPVNYGWFTGFNAQKDLPVALCILVEDIPDGETGGTTAALIAHDVFSWLKRNPDLLTR